MTMTSIMIRVSLTMKKATLPMTTMRMKTMKKTIEQKTKRINLGSHVMKRITMLKLVSSLPSLKVFKLMNKRNLVNVSLLIEKRRRKQRRALSNANKKLKWTHQMTLPRERDHLRKNSSVKPANPSKPKDKSSTNLTSLVKTTSTTI